MKKGEKILKCLWFKMVILGFISFHISLNTFLVCCLIDMLVTGNIFFEEKWKGTTAIYGSCNNLDSVFGSGRWTQDFASLDCTAWIQPRLQAMAWCDQWVSGYKRNWINTSPFQPFKQWAMYQGRGKLKLRVILVYTKSWKCGDRLQRGLLTWQP
jgi:hypothetical protein